jgi:hypothetical protein
MAVYKIFPEKDATMYSLFPQMNTGTDEILDISNLNFAIDTFPQVARYLVQFDQGQIDDVLETKIFPIVLANTSSWDVSLKFFIATAQGINLDSRAHIYPVSGSWGMGTGKYLDIPIVTNGVSWEYQIMSGSKKWDTVSTNFNKYVTASFDSTNPGGGTWYTGSTYSASIAPSQTFSYLSDKDLTVGVKGIIEAWYSSSDGNLVGNNTVIDNNGFLVKWEGYNSYEDATGNYYIEFNPNKNVQPVLQYYSVDTHTIYPPQLEFKWDDFVYDTGSNTSQSVINTPQMYVSIPNNTGFFYSQSIQQFRVDCRPQYPPIIFQTASIYTQNYYLPTASYWAIKDLDTNEYIVDFDSTYTKLSADATSSYFTVYMNGLQPERYYTILLQTTVGGTTQVVDSGFNFKVING